VSFGQVVVARDEEEDVGRAVAGVSHQVEADAEVNALLLAFTAEPTEPQLHLAKFANPDLLWVGNRVSRRVVPVDSQQGQARPLLSFSDQGLNQGPVLDVDAASQRRPRDTCRRGREEVSGVNVERTGNRMPQQSQRDRQMSGEPARARSAICDSGVMAQGRPDCDGYVASLLDHRVLCTGKTYVDGEWLKRPDLRRAISSKGGRTVEGTRNASVTLVIVGDLPDSVTDPINRRSQNLVYAEEQRAKGNHICIVDESGISALLRGDEAPCLRSRAVGSGDIELSLPPPRKPSAPCLVPLKLVVAPRHDATGLELDLSGLDTGTAAHHGSFSSPSHPARAEHTSSTTPSSSPRISFSHDTERPGPQHSSPRGQPSVSPAPQGVR